MEFPHLSTMATSILQFSQLTTQIKFKWPNLFNVFSLYSNLFVHYTPWNPWNWVRHWCARTQHHSTSTITHIEHPCPPIACRKWQLLGLCDRLHHTHGMACHDCPTFKTLDMIKHNPNILQIIAILHAHQQVHPTCNSINILFSSFLLLILIQSSYILM